MSKNLFMGFLSFILGLSLVFTSCSIVNKMQGNDIATAAFNGGGNRITVSMGVIWVNLKPTQSAVAGELYNVDLYEKGTFRATTTVSFTQPQINIGDLVTVTFPATADENNAYAMKDVSNIFSVKVHEPVVSTEPALINQNENATLTLTYPKGGEIWHVGQKVNITWTSTNLTKNAAIFVSISNDSGQYLLPLTGLSGTPNTGNYKWVVTTSYTSPPGWGFAPNFNTSLIGSHIRIKVDFLSDFTYVEGSLSIADFTILEK